MSDGPWDPTKGRETQAPPDIPTISKDNVVSMEGKKRKQKSEKPAGDDAKDVKRCSAEIHADVSAMIRRSSSMPPLLSKRGLEFTERFHSVSFDGGITKTMIEVVGDDGVCRPIGLQRVVDSIVWYCGKVIVGIAGFRLDHRQSIECAKYWLAEDRSIAPPAPFLFKSQKGLCYHKIPFDPTPMPTPLFDEMQSRMDWPEAAAAFCGSLFDPDADRQQYLYLYGQGGDGKGTLARLLSRLLGASATSLSSPPQRGNKHWACDYVNRRLVVFSDLTDARALRSAELRSVTGGDAVTVDPKRQASYSATLTCKLLFCSNELPELSATAADARRIIFVEMTPPKERMDGYEQALWDEAPGIVHKWIAAYELRRLGAAGEIRLKPVERSKIEKWSGRGDDVFQAWFDEDLVIDGEGGVMATDIARRLELRDGGRKRGAFAQGWYAWLRRTHPGCAESEVVKCKGVSKRCYYGMRLRQPLGDDARHEDIPKRPS